MRPQLVAALAGVASAFPAAQDLLANLDYGTFQGAYSSRYNISYWQKIPYAAPPVGENRFRAPQPPLSIEGVYDSSQRFDMCPQRTVNGSEDCLYLGLYSRPWTPSQPLRPVIVTFHGGGFVQGAATFTPPPSAYPILNVSETMNLLFVYPSYRLNAFGFLPGREIAADDMSDTNAGLRDQEYVLQWTRKYIRQFGGDPDKVTVWGQSAGGGSVLAQVIASRHRSGEPLFDKALASSPFWPKTYRYDSAEAQDIYDTLAKLTGCAGADSLKCLKTVDVQKIRDASLVITDSHKWTTSSFTWGPVVGDDFLPVPLSQATSEKAIVPHAFSMYNTHEGESFINATVSAAGDFDIWLEDYLPGLSKCDVSQIGRLYPPSGIISETESYSDAFTRAGLVYRDTVLTCPALWTAGAAETGWLGEYTMAPARHASDVYWWNTINEAHTRDLLHYQGYAGALASFFATGDPNKLKLTEPAVAGTPKLASGKRWIIDEAGFGTGDVALIKQRRNLWRRLSHKIPI
ncbi:acetylcholinesterase [Stachybotrys elegans]|uniref:Carboxylic ester hydrolase n=1 Tax=Stachybotrys elegans TaxID=80388 RepID=A0A8K0WLN7_9HYPO|nr:acetylcholinesterase [Stachybotrys elegans]